MPAPRFSVKHSRTSGSMYQNLRTKCGAITLALVLMGGLLFQACRSTSSKTSLQRFQFTSPHMGTLFSVTVYARDHMTAAGAAQSAFQRVAALEDIMSDYKADSELMRLCDQPYGTPVQV